jgi:hypothetical protein
MAIKANGNVGIGTVSPSEKLDVLGNIKIYNETGLITDYGPLIGRYNTSQVYIGTGGSYSIVKIARADGGALNVLSGGNVGIGTDSPNYKLDVNGGINIYSGNGLRWGSGDAEIINSGYSLLFKTYNGSALAEAMRITTAGNVGIGTTAPAIPRGSGFRPMLHVYNNSAGTNPAIVVSAEDSQMAGYIAGDNAGGSDIGWGWNAYYQGNGNNFYNIRIGDNGTWTDRFTIDRYGNIGIGTTNPLAKLDVAGNVYIRTGSSLFTDVIASYSTGNVSINGSTNFIVPSGTVTVGSRLALQPSYFGYSSSYKTLLIGSAGTDYTTNAVSLAFNVDITGNPSGAFNGSGQEYIWRNAGVFITPNAANTTYNTLFSWNSSGQLTFNQAATFSSTVTATSFSGGSYPYNSILGSGADASTATVSAGSTNGYASSIDVAGGGATNPNTIIFKTASVERLRINTNITDLTGSFNISEKLGVTGVASVGAKKLSMGILDLNSGVTPAQYKIKTSIPWNYGGSDFTVNIKGFRYGTGQMVSLSIGWHYYNNEFYNRTAISNGAWAPTISLAKSSDGYVIIYIPGPDYWPKLYIESVYSSNSTDSYTSGWSWSDANLSDCTLIQTVPYGALATNISGNAATATSATTASALSSMNISQFTNNSGYITGYTETDTLASVTNRGNSTTDRINVRGIGNQGGGNIMMGNVGEGTNKWSYLTATHYNASSQPQGFALIGGLATSGGNAVVIGGNIYETNPATEIQFWTYGTNTHNLGGTQRGVINSSGNWGIGTTNPGDYKLYVNGGQFGTLLRGGDLGTGSDVVRMIKSDGSAAMLVRGDGKVGIGTLSPSEELHVLGRGIFDGGSGNSSTDAVVYITKSTNDDWGLYVNNAGLDYGMYTRVSPSANYAFAIHNGTTWTTRITGNALIYLGEKNAIEGNYDSWLRLNNSNHYASGVYTPGVMRADGGFNVSGSTVWHAGNDGSGSGLDADLLDGQNSTEFLRLLSGGAEASLDSYTDNGLRPVSFAGHSQHLLSWNAGGSTGTVQQLFHYGVPNNGWRIRNKTDNSSWSDWGYVVMASSNQGLISGTIATQSWVGSQSYATTSYVTTQINNLIAGAPGALDTLDELAAALGDDASFATTVTNSIAAKLPLAGGTMTGDLVIGVGASIGSSQPFGDFSQLRFDNLHSDTNRGPNKIVMHDNGGSWIGGFGIHSDTVSYYTGGHHRWYKTDSPTSSSQVMQLDASGNLTIAGSLTESSSLKLKENIETSEGNLEKVVNLRPVTYNKIGSQTTELGLIAEEVAEVYPEFVQYDESGEPIGVNYSRLTAALIGAVKELTQRIETLENNG